jgi:peptidyl-tRNA hydrolase, PTH1 family
LDFQIFDAGWVRALDIETEAPAKIIVGLGNPGAQYTRNRHNVGFMVLDALAREVTGNWSTLMHTRTCRVEIKGCQALLVEPFTYMNNSGKAVDMLLSAIQRSSQDLLVLLDDLSLPLGRIRIRERGTAGGHHGLESILVAFNTDEIVRMRLGIGEEQMPKDKADFVLSDFPQEKQAELDDMILKAGNAVKSFLRDGVAKTMAIYNA